MTTVRLNDTSSQAAWTIDKSVFAIQDGKVVATSEFLSHAHQLCARLPDNRYAINLCEDRYLFCVAFMATLMKRTINLLPPNRTSQVISEIQSQYPGYCITDQHHCDLTGDFFRLSNDFKDNRATILPSIPEHQVAAIAFSSGSTGKPKSTKRTWGAFSSAARCAVQSLNLGDQSLLVVATVPAQHMFGLETSIFWPLHSNLSLFHGRPFFPTDIKAVVESSPIPCLLVSTPTHLRACTTLDSPWRNVAAVISSTAPLHRQLANRVESKLDAQVVEIFGSTETFSYATRRTAQDERWRLYEKLNIVEKNNRCFLRAPYFNSAVELEDRLDVHPDRTFSVVGRSQDLVKVAGKRASLTELNQRLANIEGVVDGTFIVPEHGLESQRLSAVVVTHLSKQAVVNELRKSIDEVFLPRPLYVADRLPRNPIGKICKSDLLTFLASLCVKDQR